MALWESRNYTLSFEQATTQKTLAEVVDVTLDVYTAENKQ